jgi:hypothetical protein
MKTKTLLLLLIITLKVYSQCQTKSPTKVSVSSVGVAWNNINNISVSDNKYAVTNQLSNGDTSQYIIATGFNFTIPTTRITGVIANIEKSNGGGGGNIKDYSVKLVINGKIVGNNLASNKNWKSSDDTTNYGADGNTWGNMLTSSDVDSLNFGVAIQVTKKGGGKNTARIDNIILTICYINDLPIELLYFDVTKLNGINKLTWATASETNNNYFYILRSQNGILWQVIDSIKGAGNSTSNLYYSAIDDSFNSCMNYYILKQVDFDGKYKNSDVVNVDNSNNSNRKIILITDLSGHKLDELQEGIINVVHYDDNINPEKIILIK